MKVCDLGVVRTQNTLHLLISSLVPTGVNPRDEKQHLVCVRMRLNGELLQCYDLVYISHLLLTVPLSTNPLFISTSFSVQSTHLCSKCLKPLNFKQTGSYSIMCKEMSFRSSVSAVGKAAIQHVRYWLLWNLTMCVYVYKIPDLVL